MKLTREILAEIVQIFEHHEVAYPRRQAEELLCDLLDYSRIELYTALDHPLTHQEITLSQLWVERRLQGEPLAYICGKVEFYGCSLDIDVSVLIPRQETEILVDKVVSFLAKQELKDKVFLDLCCGSGCIGIAIKKRFPGLSVYLSDASQEALDLAKHNALRNHVQVSFLKGDLLTPFQGHQAHYVVCNPPYISYEEYDRLDKDVKNYEPRLALVANQNGLEFYERLARELPAYLYPKAQVWLEIGYQQGEFVKNIFNKIPWKHQQLENDWAGHHRFFFLENE